MNEPTTRLSVDGQTFDFVVTPLVFGGGLTKNLFARKNNKTVRETILHPKYAALGPLVLAQHAGSLDARLGEFLVGLEAAGDPFYEKFLNKHGDGQYCEFRLGDPAVKRLKGLYCFTVSGELKYVGKSTDSFAKRIDQGYGRVHPKNCYRDGQSTNCHLNGLIAGVSDGVRLHLHPMLDDGMIESAETALIVKYQPQWNVQLRNTAASSP